MDCAPPNQTEYNATVSWGGMGPAHSQRHFSQQFLPETQGVECLDMGTSRFVWLKLHDFCVLEWKEGSTSYAPSPPDCGMLKRPYFHLRTPSFFNFHQTNLLVPMSKHSTPCDSGRNCWLKWRCDYVRYWVRELLKFFKVSLKLKSKQCPRLRAVIITASL